MSRSQKKKKKQKRNLIIGISTIAIVGTVVALYFFGVFTKWFADEVIPDKIEQIHVDVEEGQNNGVKNTSDGDLTKDMTHELPYYLQVYLGNKDAENPILAGKDTAKETDNKKDTNKKDEEKDNKEDDITNEKPSKESNDEVNDENKEETSLNNEETSNKNDSNTNENEMSEEEYMKAFLEEGYMEIHFIDVGQGDASLVKYVDTNLENGDDSGAMLIDAGDGTCGTLVRNYISKQGVKELDYFVCTHPDADHIGGAASVVSNVPIKSEIVWGPDYEKDTKTYENLMNEIKTKYYKYEQPEMMEIYTMGKINFYFIAPTEKHEDVNSNSLVMIINCGKDNFAMMGDCEEEEEQEILNGEFAEMVESGTLVDLTDCSVIKIGHHGSKTSSSSELLELLKPEYAVISCGEGNKYAHPHAAALNNIRMAGMDLFRTDVQGSIVATTKGDGITWNASPCNDWSSGEAK